jgi:adenosylcobyric acid synthase
MRTPAVMLQGTGSDVGKSLLVAGLARALLRRGLSVAPFKPQNMSNNAAAPPPTGRRDRPRAGAAGARGGRPPSVDMNPVLLKPQSDMGAQVIVQGRSSGPRGARLLPIEGPAAAAVLESFERLGADADILLVEGAGSPAEVNLRPATSPIWDSRRPRMCPSSWSATSTAAA